MAGTGVRKVHVAQLRHTAHDLLQVSGEGGLGCKQPPRDEGAHPLEVLAPHTLQVSHTNISCLVSHRKLLSHSMKQAP